MDAVTAPGSVADQVLLRAACSSALGTTHSHTFPSTAGKVFGRSVGNQLALRDQGDVGGRRFDVRHDMGRENDDAIAGEIREQIAEADPLFRIQSGRGFIDDQQLWIVQQRLRDADALPHASGVSAQRAFAHIGQIDQIQQFIDAAARGGCVQAFHGSEIFEEFDRVQIRIDAEILRQISELPRMPSDQPPCRRRSIGLAVGRARNRRQDAHQRCLSRAVGSEKSENTGTKLKGEL